MTETFEDLSFDLEEDGRLVRKEIGRAVLSRGTFPALMFLYQEIDRRTGRFGAPRVALVRLRKWHGGYRKLSSFTIASPSLARDIARTIERWLPEMEAGPEGDGESVEDAPDDADAATRAERDPPAD